MRLGSKKKGQAGGAPAAALPAPRRDPRAPWMWALGALAILNAAAFVFLYRPFGGSVADLEASLQSLRASTRAEQTQLHQARDLATKVDSARSEQNGFVRDYFMDRRTTSSTILAEIDTSAKKAGLKPREHTFVIEPVEGSDDLSMMTINANYEGSYADLIEFVNLVDRSRRFLIIDSLQAAPLQQAGTLSARFRMNTFIQDARSVPAPPPPQPGSQPAANNVGAQP
ncbi:MAG: hypothetical protein R2729_24610 [Bryobacteraceae bacterium]